MYELRNITSDEDFKKVKLLWTVHARLMRTKVPERTDLDVGTIVGAFKDGELAATIRHHEWTGQPWYSMDSIYVKPGEMTLYASREGVVNPIVPLVDHVIEQYEARGFYTWFYVRALSPGYSRIHKNGHSFLASSRLGSRYQKHLMEIVKAGTRSQFQAHDALLGQRTFDKDCIVVMQCLKNEFRQCVVDLGPEAEYF
jgi:hypothetical protein